jgi:hypothetical protein
MNDKQNVLASDTPTLPDWTRWSWRSPVEREWWNPLFKAAANAYESVERLSVVDGVRSAASQIIAPEELVGLTEWARNHNILCIPIDRISYSNSYSSVETKLKNGERFKYRVLFVRPEQYADTVDLSNISSRSDRRSATAPSYVDRFGKLLGFPECCRKAFLETWGRGQVDSTWEQHCSPMLPMTSTLLRWMGLRLVSHMPCHYRCEASQKIAEQMFQVGARHGYLEEMRLIKEVLAWPVKWSRLFGIAEIVTPAVKISTRTDWTPRKDEFSTTGPYRQPKKTWWINNGFDNARDLGRAHGDMVNALITQLPQKARVLDLGCGNGMLLRRLTIHRPDVRVAGIDSNADAIREAQETIDLRSTFWSGKIEDGIWRDWNPTAVLYTPGRMMETNTGGMSEAATLRVATWIRDIPWQFPYIYDDMILRKINVPALCEDKQLPVPLPLIKTPLVEMGIVAPFT